jgi:hypothetical protein
LFFDSNNMNIFIKESNFNYNSANWVEEIIFDLNDLLKIKKNYGGTLSFNISNRNLLMQNDLTKKMMLRQNKGMR